MAKDTVHSGRGSWHTVHRIDNWAQTFKLIIVNESSQWRLGSQMLLWCMPVAYNAGALAGQPMLKRSSSCKMQRVMIVASSVEVHCLRYYHQMG